MTLFVDTSALLKRYVDEPGREETVSVMDAETTWCASTIIRCEARLALCKLIDDEANRAPLLEQLDLELKHFALVPVDEFCLERAAQIGCQSGVRTLDAIHLAAAERLPGPLRFLTFDARQKQAAGALGFAVS